MLLGAIVISKENKPEVLPPLKEDDPILSRESWRRIYGINYYLGLAILILVLVKPEWIVATLAFGAVMNLRNPLAIVLFGAQLCLILI